jgi:tyrosine-specific transport protein
MPKGRGSVLGAVLLVTGTTVGAGMLGMPLSTGLAGFVPSVVLLALIWIAMYYGTLLILEANFWVPEKGNMISMAEKLLGHSGTLFTWVVYLFLLYALLTAYIAGSLPLMQGLTGFITGGTSLPLWAGVIPLIGLCGVAVYRGAQSTDRFNRILMVGMTLSYILLVGLAAGELDLPKLQHADWLKLPLGVTTVATSFGFAIIIPTLRSYLQGDVKRIKRSIFIGSLISFVVYLIWETAILGVVPVEDLANGYEKGITSFTLLKELSEEINRAWLPLVGEIFALFAIVTSFIGVSLCLMDFLADGLKVQSRPLLFCLTFVPPLIINFSYARVFLTALEHAGAFGVILLLLLIPALMVWRGRYRLGLSTQKYRTPGGKAGLIAAMLVSLLVVGVHCVLVLGW